MKLFAVTYSNSGDRQFSQVVSSENAFTAGIFVLKQEGWSWCIMPTYEPTVLMDCLEDDGVDMKPIMDKGGITSDVFCTVKEIA